MADSPDRFRRRQPARRIGVLKQRLAAWHRLGEGPAGADDGLSGPGRRQRPDRRAGQARDAAFSGRPDRGHVHARPGRPASRRALSDLSLRSGRPDQQGRHDRPGHGEPQRPGSEYPELGRQQAAIHRPVRRQSAAERPARRCGDREHHVGGHELHQRTAGDRARAGRLVLRVPPLGARGGPSGDLGAGGDRSRQLHRQHPHARRLDRELGARGRLPGSARRGGGLRAVRRQPAPQRAARRADARGRRRHRAQHLRPRRAAGRADRMRRAAGTVRPARPHPVRRGRDSHAPGRPDHAGVADPAAGHAGLPRPEGAAASRTHKARPGRTPGRAGRSLLAALGRRARPQAADPRRRSRWR